MESYGWTDMEDQCLMFQTRSKLQEENIPLEMDDGLFSDAWGVDHTDFLSQEELSVFNEVYDPLRDQLLVPWIPDPYLYSIADSSSSPNEVSMPLPPNEDQFPFPSQCFLEEEEGLDAMDGFGFSALEAQDACKEETSQESPGQVPGFINAGPVPCPRRKGRSKGSGGQPSKNLMAERRRRKRLNDRLSMLRSIVPKISKVNIIINWHASIALVSLCTLEMHVKLRRDWLVSLRCNLVFCRWTERR